MDAPIIAASPAIRLPDPQAKPPGPAAPDAAELTRELIELQREQLRLTRARHAEAGNVAATLCKLLEASREQVALLKAQQAANDSLTRWRAFLARWGDEFPGVGGECKALLPQVERAYLSTLQELTEKLRDEEYDLGGDFSLAEFLDRYATRLGQLGTILNQLGPIADAAPPDPS